VLPSWPSVHNAATNAKRQPGNRLPVGIGEARDGALADAFARGGDNFDFLGFGKVVRGARNSPDWGIEPRGKSGRKRVAPVSPAQVVAVACDA
jgi:hypothetical protein